MFIDCNKSQAQFLMAPEFTYKKPDTKEIQCQIELRKQKEKSYKKWLPSKLQSPTKTYLLEHKSKLC